MVAWKATLGAFAASALAGCGLLFDYDTATTAEREAWLAKVSHDLYDRLDEALPHGEGGAVMSLRERNYDANNRRVEMIVDARFRGAQSRFDGYVTRRSILEELCPDYLGSVLDRKGVAIVIRYALDGGGTLAAAKLTTRECARYGN